MQSIKKFFKKLVCCSSNIRVELKTEKTKIERKDCQEHTKFLSLADLQQFQINGINYFLTKNTLKLNVIEPVATLKPHDFIGYKHEDIFPHEAILENVLPEKNTEKPTLVLDLDHTLVYPSSEKLSNYDFTVNVTYNKKVHKMYFIKRPGLEEFLKNLSEHYELVLYTAGIMQYALKVLKYIDPERRILYCLDRSYCSILSKNGISKDFYVKNLNILGRDLSKTIIVDDKQASYVMHPNNGQTIPGFFGQQSDNALFLLAEYLIKIKDINNFKEREQLSFD
ncbi:PSR2 [Ecytonucleospora hepatopenaei]|uniref:Mitochondrial import inner membrane translocase subunit TIM50 n=1 Tax=Ecytonucleospora hepatopenaei TaxID=646526 RepID=A0A1W0E5Y9_9MICR|nr:PSR2 [Ecytonucleospora hepatopenaei]